MALSCIVSDVFDFEQYSDLETTQNWYHTIACLWFPVSILDTKASGVGQGRRWTLMDCSAFRTIWHVLSSKLQCQWLPLTCDKSCISYPSDTVSSSSWQLLPWRQNCLASQGTPAIRIPEHSGHPQLIFYTNRSLLSHLFHVPSPLPLQLSGTNCLLAVSLQLVSARLNLSSNSTPLPTPPSTVQCHHSASDSHCE